MTSFLDECIAAAKGCAALLVGQREAARYFDFSQRGLVGSFIGLLLVVAVTTYLPLLFGLGTAAGSTAVDLLMTVLLYGLEILFAYIALRQIRRADGFVPFLVADNWGSVVLSVTLLLLTLVGFGPVAVLAIGVAALVLKINTARLIVTLAPLQVAIFVVAQFVGVLLWFLMLLAMVPLSPETLGPVANPTP